MNLEMCAAARTLGVRAKWTFPTGAVAALTGAEVVGFTIEEGADSPLLPGAVLSAQLTMDLADDAGQWRWGGSIRGARPMVGSTVELFLINGESEMPCGAFVISSVSAREHSGCVRVTGCDSIAGELSAAFEDTLTYPATLGQIWSELVGQTRYVWSGGIPNGAAVIDAMPDWKGATLRRAAGWIAQAAGCFVRVDRAGALELADCAGGAAEALSPQAYMSLDDGCDSFGPVAALHVTPVGAEEASVYSDGDGEALSIRDNPLYQAGAAGLDALATGTLARLKGLTLNRAEFRWRGDPSVGVGARIALTDTHGATRICTITRQTLRFQGGFSAECACETPQEDASGVMRAITPEGGVNAGALVGTVDGGLLAVDSVTAQKIAAGAVTARQIAAGAITADKIAAGAVTAQSVEAVTAALGSLTAGEIETNALYAAVGHVVELAAGSISAGKLSADQLASALAEVISLYAKTGEFDFATVKNLLAGAMLLEQGYAETVAIKNLLVSSANLLNAVIGDLVLRSADGKYYAVTVGSDGALGAEEVTVTDGEINAGATSDGRGIVETSANIANLAAGTIAGESAIINSILTTALTAGKITAGEALIASATIPALYTTAIRAIGGSLDLSANESIQLLVGRTDALAEKSTVRRQEEMPEGAADGDLWIQPSTGRTWQYSEGAAGAPSFALSDGGQLAYAYASGQTAYALQIGEDGWLSIDADARMLIDPDGAAGAWLLVTDTNEIDERLTSAESSILQTPEQIRFAVERVQIGGTNLYTGTKDFSGDVWKNLTSWTASAETYDGLAVRTRTGVGAGLYQSVAATAGEQFVLSAWVKLDGTAQIRASGANASVSGLTAVAGTDWQRVSAQFTATADAALAVCFDNSAAGGTMSICGLKLERGNKATGWTAAPGEFFAGTAVSITDKRFKVAMPSDGEALFTIMDAGGEDELLRIDQEGMHARHGEFDELTSPSVVATQFAATFAPASNGELSAILEELADRSLRGDVAVNASAVTGGVYALRGVCGRGAVRISGGAINGFSVENCSAWVVFNQTSFSTGGTALAADGARVRLTGCALNAGVGVKATGGAEVVLDGCSGVCATVARAEPGSCVTFINGAPYGLPDLAGGNVFSDALLVNPPPDEPEPVAPVVQSATLTPTLTRTYNGNWRDGHYLWQGRYGTLGLNRGCMWFDTAAFAGKTVLSASLSLKRMSGAGSGAAVAVKICGTTATGASGTPAIGTQYASVSIAPGARRSVDVTAAAQALANGTIKGLMLYDSSTSNLSTTNNWTTCYAKLYGYDSGDRPVLTVTWAG